jgi:hypothetical protein
MMESRLRTDDSDNICLEGSLQISIFITHMSTRYCTLRGTDIMIYQVRLCD